MHRYWRPLKSPLPLTWEEFSPHKLAMKRSDSGEYFTLFCRPVLLYSERRSDVNPVSEYCWQLLLGAPSWPVNCVLRRFWLSKSSIQIVRCHAPPIYFSCKQFRRCFLNLTLCGDGLSECQGVLWHYFCLGIRVNSLSDYNNNSQAWWKGLERRELFQGPGITISIKKKDNRESV